METDYDHAIMRESFSLVQNTLFIDYSDVLPALNSEPCGGSALEGTPAVVLISLITRPHPSPKLVTPTRTCLPSTSTVKGPPLSPWGAKSIVFHVSFCNPHITVKMVGHQNLGMMQKMGKLAKTSHKSLSCIC